MHLTYLIGAESGGLSSLFTALGVSWRGLFLNAVSFLFVVLILRKYVYPTLTRALDAKKDELEAAVKLEKSAQEQLSKAESSAGHITAEARTAAEEIVASARNEATQVMEVARGKATAQTERIMAEAREELKRDVAEARRQLKADTAGLVVAATESLLGEKLDGERDAALIGRTLETKR